MFTVHTACRDLPFASVTKAAASAVQDKGSKATVVDLEKVNAGLSHSDNIALRDLDSDGVNKHIAAAKVLTVDTVAATAEQQYQFLVTHATCYALLVLGFRVGLKVMNPGNMEFLLGHISAARMSAKTLLVGRYCERDYSVTPFVAKMFDWMTLPE